MGDWHLLSLALTRQYGVRAVRFPGKVRKTKKVSFGPQNKCVGEGRGLASDDDNSYSWEVLAVKDMSASGSKAGTVNGDSGATWVQAVARRDSYLSRAVPSPKPPSCVSSAWVT